MTGPSTQRSEGRKGKSPGVSLTVHPKARLFDVFHPSRRMYLLESGRVRLSTDAQAVLDHLKPGDFFGEKFLLSPRQREQTAAALSVVNVSCFRKRELLDHLQDDRRFAMRLLKNLALRLDRYEQAIRDFVVDPAEVRLARLLSRVAPARRASEWVRLPVALTNLELAKMIGTTRWRVSHFLHYFERLGWLKLDGGIWLKRDGLTRFLVQWRRPSSRRPL